MRLGNLKRRLDRLSPPSSETLTVTAEAPEWMPEEQVRADVAKEGFDQPFALIVLRRPNEDCAKVSVASAFPGSVNDLLKHVAANGRRIGEGGPPK